MLDSVFRVELVSFHVAVSKFLFVHDVYRRDTGQRFECLVYQLYTTVRSRHLLHVETDSRQTIRTTGFFNRQVAGRCILLNSRDTLRSVAAK